MLLRSTVACVSDVCTLQKDIVSWDDVSKTWRVLVRTQESGEPIYRPVQEKLGRWNYRRQSQTCHSKRLGS